MASSKEFKQAIREGRLNDAFAIAMGNAPELHITTWVASADGDSSQPRQQNSLQTHVNLVEGEIINEIGEQLIGDELYASLQQFHLQQVTQGHQTMSQNLQSLQQMFRLLAVLQKQQKGEAYTPIKPWKITDTALPPAAGTSVNLENNSDGETLSFSPISEFSDLSTIDDEEDIVNDLLSLDDLDLEIDSPSQEHNPEIAAKNDEDWGDWLNEDNSGQNSPRMELNNLDLQPSEDWQDEDWGEETEVRNN